MAFKAKDLSVLAYANGFTLWHYLSADALSDIDSAGYFADAADMLRVGDVVIANAGMGAAPATALLLVRQSDAGGVDVSDGTTIGASNLD